MYESTKNLFSKKVETNNSFCREIIFHGKEILSYCTTSSIHFNATISCLSIKDIISVYFPYSSIDEFIQICRKKQITRFKPDKSTNYDSTLRLVDIQQLENNWNFIIKELLPNTQNEDKCVSLSNNLNDILSSKQNIYLEENENNEQINLIENKCSILKRNRKANRYRNICISYRNKRRRRRRRRNDQEFWMKKYSIESFSIVINRYKLP